MKIEYINRRFGTPKKKKQEAFFILRVIVCYLKLSNMIDLKEKEKQIKAELLKKYGIKTSNKWLRKYIWFYAKCITPLETMNSVDAINYIYSNMDTFAFFIYGMRAEYNHNRL